MALKMTLRVGNAFSFAQAHRGHDEQRQVARCSSREYNEHPERAPAVGPLRILDEQDERHRVPAQRLAMQVPVIHGLAAIEAVSDIPERGAPTRSAGGSRRTEQGSRRAPARPARVEPAAPAARSCTRQRGTDADAEERMMVAAAPVRATTA